MNIAWPLWLHYYAIIGPWAHFKQIDRNLTILKSTNQIEEDRYIVDYHVSTQAYLAYNRYSWNPLLIVARWLRECSLQSHLSMASTRGREWVDYTFNINAIACTAQAELQYMAENESIILLTLTQ